MKIDLEKELEASKLRGSLHEFIKFFVKHITNRDYIQSNPLGRESHQITICRELSSFARMEHPDENLMINVEPGSGKSLHICMWIAWCYARNPQCNFIYTSYSQTLAAEQTAFIKQIMVICLMYLYRVTLKQKITLQRLRAVIVRLSEPLALSQVVTRDYLDKIYLVALSSSMMPTSLMKRILTRCVSKS